MIKEDYKNKSILVLGGGREGLAMLAFLRNLFPTKKLAIADKKESIKVNDKNTETFFGDKYLDNISDFDIIIKSPGVPLALLSSAKNVTSPTQIFFDNCQGTIIGITGTKGKSTTASLIYKILKDAKLNVELVGNIGKPAITFLSSDSKEKIYVFELSSFQLENLTKSPHIAVFLNIFEEHLDIHKSFDDYVNAKLNITKWQNQHDYLVYNKDYESFFNQVTKSIKRPISTVNTLHIKDIPLKGDFNMNNIQAAICVSRIFKIPERITIASIKTFKPLRHRLQDVGVFKGITFYNDSIATNPMATIAAIEALKTNLETLITGGFDRRLDYKPLAEKILNEKIKVVIVLPTTGEKIIEALKKIKPNKLPKIFTVNNMKEAVSIAFANTQAEHICLMSPASASFNLFNDYEDRGNQFMKYVKNFK